MIDSIFAKQGIGFLLIGAIASFVILFRHFKRGRQANSNNNFEEEQVKLKERTMDRSSILSEKRLSMIVPMNSSKRNSIIDKRSSVVAADKRFSVFAIDKRPSMLVPDKRCSAIV